MRLLRRGSTGEFSLKNLAAENTIPPYAILSHTWGEETDEVTFKDLTNGIGEDKSGYEKIRFCGDQAWRDGLQYFWIDTCCINKANKGELSLAINSMFRWYRNAARCYVYLSDVSSSPSLLDANEAFSLLWWESSFRTSRWFTRGWTLQEVLAPSSVEFFSREHMRLGDIRSLTLQIHEITGIPKSALQGTPLSQFSVNERLSWIEHRQTKLEEDKAYSLLGIFDVYIPPLYGEGTARAFKRLMDEIDKLEKCMQDLRLTDPRDDKKRIEETKGGLLEDSYSWILKTPDFQRWRDDQQSRLLWIKGDPGKGKTMLLCGIINDLKKLIAKRALLSYFFCQATDSRINNATAVVRGLLYLLVNQQPSLILHIRKKHDHAGKALFEDANAWVALSEIFTNILQDPSLNSTYLVIDALDECVADLPKLLDFIVQKSFISSRVKWIVASRNNTNIERRLRLNDSGTRLSLELGENARQVSRAVATYIDYYLSELPELQHNMPLRDSVQKKMQQKANGTFLWVSLVMKELKDVMAWEILDVLEEVPMGLKDVYHRMMQQIKQLQRQYPELCRQVLSVIIATYRPLHLQELHVLSDLPTQIQDTATIVKMCGSFLTIRNNNVYIIHQSARDFLSKEASYDIFPHGDRDVHRSIFSRSLEIMSRTLQRDMYSLDMLGYPTERVKQPNPDPLAASRYSCIYWVDHLCNWNPNSSVVDSVDLKDEGTVHSFIRKKYLYWLEALSLCKSMSEGVVALAKLEALIQERVDASALIELVRDACRFILYHRWAIQNSPLQAYASGLMFSPTRSLIKGIFQEEAPKKITIKSNMRDEWGACLQTLEDHLSSVGAVTFSPDGKVLSSASTDQTIKLWDAGSGAVLRTLQGHSDAVGAVAFSPDGKMLASASYDKTVKLWDVSSGAVVQTLEGHLDGVGAVAFSPRGKMLVSASYDKTVKVWDIGSRAVLQTLEGHSETVGAIAFSPDGKVLASASYDKLVKLWDASSWVVLHTLEGHSSAVGAVAFSPDSKVLASASRDKTVKLWEVESGAVLQTLKDHSGSVWAVTFSPDGKVLVSASSDKTIKLWDAGLGTVLQTLEGHLGSIWTVAFSPDSKVLASASYDKTVKLWDVRSRPVLQTLGGHLGSVWAVAFSPDGNVLASASNDKTVKLWDAKLGAVLQTLVDHLGSVGAVAFSADGKVLASASTDQTVKLWDVRSGAMLQTLKSHSGSVWAVAFSPDSNVLASASNDKMVKLWDASLGVILQTLKGHSGSVGAVVFSPDGKVLASASTDQMIKLWDVGSGALLQTLQGHSGSVQAVAFSLDSKVLASASRDETVKLWDAGSGVVLQTLGGYATIRVLSFSNDGTFLHTDRGVLHVTSLPYGTAVFQPNSFRAIFLKDQWLGWGTENMIWLPSEYRASCVALYKGIVALGTASGCMLVFDFELGFGAC